MIGVLIERIDYSTESYTMKVSWCYSKSNLISLYDMQINQQFNGYQGTQLKAEGGILKS